MPATHKQKPFADLNRETETNRMDRISAMSTVVNIGVDGKAADIGLKLGNIDDLPHLMTGIVLALVSIQHQLGISAQDALTSGIEVLGKTIAHQYGVEMNVTPIIQQQPTVH